MLFAYFLPSASGMRGNRLSSVSDRLDKTPPSEWLDELAQLVSRENIVCCQHSCGDVCACLCVSACQSFSSWLLCASLHQAFSTCQCCPCHMLFLYVRACAQLVSIYLLCVPWTDVLHCSLLLKSDSLYRQHYWTLCNCMFVKACVCVFQVHTEQLKVSVNEQYTEVLLISINGLMLH